MFKTFLRMTQSAIFKKSNSSNQYNLQKRLSLSYTYPASEQHPTTTTPSKNLSTSIPQKKPIPKKVIHKKPQVKTLVIENQKKEIVLLKKNEIAVVEEKKHAIAFPEQHALTSNATFFPLNSVTNLLINSFKNLKEHCCYAPLKTILENFLNHLSPLNDTYLEDLFFKQVNNSYRFKNLLHGWFGIKNSKGLSWVEILNELKKFPTPLFFENNQLTQIKNYLIFKFTTVYSEVEKTIPYLVTAIDLHLKNIRECNSLENLRSLIENPRDAGKHSFKKILQQYAGMPLYTFQNNVLQLKPWTEIYAYIIEELKPEIPPGIYQL